MSPQTRTSLSAIVTAVSISVIWLMVRLFVITESSGISLTEEVIVVATGYETWKNQRDQSDELAKLCTNWGFAFSKPADKSGLGRLADAPLLQRYIKVLTRMSGTTSGYLVELLDVSRWVQRQSDTGANDPFEWRHTIVLFPAQTELPTFALFPLTLADRLGNVAAGAKGITFEHASGALDEGICAEFYRQYIVWPGDRSFFSSYKAPSSDNVRDLGRVFSAELVTYLAQHPGWNVEVIAGQVAMWREDRIVPPAARASILAEAARLYHVLANKPPATHPAVRVRPEVPLDCQRFTGNLFRVFIGLGIGIWLGFFVGGAVMILLVDPFLPQGHWQPIVVFPGLFGFMMLEAYIGFRVARRYTK